MGQSASKEVAKKAAGQAKAVADPITGFMRGAGAQSIQDEQQREFLQKNSSPKEMPAELVKFMTDVGPLKPSSLNAAIDNRRRKREESLSDGHRKVESMRLAERIEGFETSRTTSFSTKEDVANPDDPGLDILQMFGLLSGSTRSESFPDDTKSLALSTSSYLSLPCLLEETTDNSFIGAHSEKVTELLKVHKSMRMLPNSRAKLVLQDLWELEYSKSTHER